MSPTTEKELFIEVCAYLNYKPIYFFAHDKSGKEIYHTNVMICIGEKFAVICLESITDEGRKEMVQLSLLTSGHELIEISFEQMSHFAGNMLELRTKRKENILVLSQSACERLTKEQKLRLKQFVELVSLSIRTIETRGGGSARCMIAEIFLPTLAK